MNEFRFEPVVNLHSGGVLYREVLFPRDVVQRFAESGSGDVGPFFESMSRSGLSTYIDMAMLERVLDMLEDSPSESFGLNVGYATLCSCGDGIIRSLLRRKKSVSERLVIEVTESERVIDWTHVETLLSVRRRGVRVALDDYGAGAHAGLGPYISRSALTPNILKLDGPTMKSQLSTERGMARYADFLEKTRMARMDIVAEHVDSDEILQKVCGLGLQFAQGFLFA